ncbi:hypothetical protein UA08_04311 [Talaromyces atroroseus]|uniref:mRNA stability protein n=1 Tax=Talaromyces atroroseus TaxID=1441469 RepID=A0A1Q5Q827_TALAT|nr:hypothetical protein UA08_04311 [Talaromyces atroroseus]OKL60288.1 hypothetical protein UA08_04311 [Talaromyces atroroseus]
MNPHQQNKVDIGVSFPPASSLETNVTESITDTKQSLSPDEQRLLRLYGKVPTKKDLLQNKLKERKYFDSGDYALSKAGKASDVGVTSIGSRHPVPENIPHLTATSPGAQNPAAATPGAGIVNGGGNNNVSNVVGSPGPIPGSISGHPGSLGFQNRNPMKEGGFVHRKSSLNNHDEYSEGKDGEAGKTSDKDEGSISPPPARQGVHIRQ